MRPKPLVYAVLHTWPPGSEPEIRYRRLRSDTRLAHEVLARQRAARRSVFPCAYSISTKPIHTL